MMMIVMTTMIDDNIDNGDGDNDDGGRELKAR